jgi:hypothetical protein
VFSFGTTTVTVQYAGELVLTSGKRRVGSALCVIERESLEARLETSSILDLVCYILSSLLNVVPRSLGGGTADLLVRGEGVVRVLVGVNGFLRG